ncbi:MAG: hypothetical protein H7X80_03745 [bacterium]|nr:hypothetical protein [Candidatus Kapabacteria bacterium]
MDHEKLTHQDYVQPSTKWIVGIGSLVLGGSFAAFGLHVMFDGFIGIMCGLVSVPPLVGFALAMRRITVKQLRTILLTVVGTVLLLFAFTFVVLASWVNSLDT